MRGDLADDQAFLDTVSASRPGSRVLWAGTLDGRQSAVTWNRASQVVEGLIASGDGTIAADSSSDFRAWPTSESAGVAVAVADRALLVVARPGTESVEVSQTAVVGVDGTVERSWPTVELDADGTATLPLERASTSRLVAVRAPGDIAVPVLTLEVDDSAFVCLDCNSDNRDQAFVAASRRDIASLFGIPTEQVTSRLRWAGPADQTVMGGTVGESAQGRLAVALSTLPNGAVLRSAQVSWYSGGGQYVATIEQAAPVPAEDADSAPFTLRGDRSVEGLVFQVVAPGASSVTLVGDDDSAVSAPQTTEDGVAVLASATPEPPTRVLASTAEGGRLWPLNVLGTYDPFVVPSPE